MSEARLSEVIAALERRGFEDSEAFAKEGRSRRFELGSRGETSVVSHERGWAVRAGTRSGSFFAAGTGLLPADGAWPAADGPALRLPPADPPPSFRATDDLDSPLIVESEAFGMLSAIAAELESESPGARLLTGVLEDGASESFLASSHGVRATTRQRLASLRLEAVGGGARRATVSIEAAVREPSRFQPHALARRLADLLHVLSGRAELERDRGDMLLAPRVGAELLRGLESLLIGPAAEAIQRQFQDRTGRVASSAVTIVDDGRMKDGLLAAAVDGEGVATRRVTLIEQGSAVQPLLAWWQETGRRHRVSGCSLRLGWRELPRPGPTHLYFEPDERIPVAQLLQSIARGYYLLDVAGAGDFDLAGDRFALPVCGYALRKGRAEAPFARAWLTGSVRGLLRGVQATARDLSFFALGGMLGAPSLLVAGLELRGSA